MKDEPLNRILLAAVIVLALGEGYLAYGMTKLQPTVKNSVRSNTAVSSTSPEASTEIAQIAPSNILTPIAGVVESVDGSHVVLANGPSKSVIIIDPSTIIVMQGVLKDSVQYASEMEAFRQSSMALAHDMQKNTGALQTLIAPSPYKEEAAQITDISLGEKVTAFTVVQDGAQHATRLILSGAHK